jgi:hypothetical protein
MKATYTLVHNRKSKLNKQGKALVQIQIYFNQERKWLSTNIYLSPKEWDAKRNEVSQHHPEADELNRELQAHIEKLKIHERNEAKVGRPLTLSSLSLDNLKDHVQGISFTEFWHTWVETDNQLEYETKRTHRSDLNRFKEFKEEVHFFELTPELLRAYEAFLLHFRFTSHKGEVKPLSYSRIHGLFKTLRAYVSRAIQEGYIESRRTTPSCASAPLNTGRWLVRQRAST